jgi:hypothetical protein
MHPVNPVNPIVPTQGVGAGVGICCDECGSFTLLNKADPERRGYCMASGAATVAGTPCLPWVRAELSDRRATIIALKNSFLRTIPQIVGAAEAMQKTLEIYEK